MNVQFAMNGEPEPLRRSLVGPYEANAPKSAPAYKDHRWPTISAELISLHARRRKAVRIVDVDCGSGSLLLHAVRYAQALGFTAIEGRGISGTPALVHRARQAAARVIHPAIGVEFEVADMLAALGAETFDPADIVIWHGGRPRDLSDDIFGALAAAGRFVVGDSEAPTIPRTAS